MDLIRYLYEENTTLTELANKFGYNRSTLCNIKRKMQSPSLLTALKLKHLSNEKIDFDLMLTDEDYAYLKEWRAKYPKK